MAEPSSSLLTSTAQRSVDLAQGVATYTQPGLRTGADGQGHQPEPLAFAADGKSARVRSRCRPAERAVVRSSAVSSPWMFGLADGPPAGTDDLDERAVLPGAGDGSAEAPAANEGRDVTGPGQRGGCPGCDE